MVQVVYEVDGRRRQKLELDLPPNFDPNSTTVCKTCKSISLTRPQIPASDTSSALPPQMSRPPSPMPYLSHLQLLFSFIPNAFIVVEIRFQCMLKSLQFTSSSSLILLQFKDQEREILLYSVCNLQQLFEKTVLMNFSTLKMIRMIMIGSFDWKWDHRKPS
ncbi:hypothetical protein HanRHA438_Chr04g0155491 [Helianthus annuus]|nr:hypothetical protein HanHA300_Chr04g0119451 [Helianthus annuus]KAJ0595471.1 hypothetical protein HanHA89_Chr04g0131721 [Helianthus annuus]KAJ0756153.1 hypothetical protein HanLR1_Chr04g0123811 [Helianthus annuus]KAJ0759928.1 hypothetical protein HanOQP8_Chr04g0132071 [Helianthus annuus]KAJ0925072.1 hypothetical protein HanRHA438_Chr04g0155491 [Helianthus annuus]